MSHNMKFPQKLFLALSCFLPLYSVFSVKNLMVAKGAYRPVEGNRFFEGQSAVFVFNTALMLVWLVLILMSVIGIFCFLRVLSGKGISGKERIKVVKAENITADYYFTYFSLFVLSFYGVDPSDIVDISFFLFLMLLILWVYIVNDLLFINPVLNLLGYRSYMLTYKHMAMREQDENQEDDINLECRVLSRERLNLCRNQERVLLVSRFDFSACVRPEEKEV